MNTVEPQIRIKASARRKTTVKAVWSGNDIIVHVPAHLSDAEQQTWAQTLAAKLIDQLHTARAGSDKLLTDRAVDLSRQYLDGQAVPASVRWVSNQNKRWGSCTPATREIRISDSLQIVPGWVLDAVLVHELAHLLRHPHDRQFWDLVHRYPRIDDADIFLAGYHLCRQHHASAA